MRNLKLKNKLISLALAGTMSLVMTSCELGSVIYNTGLEEESGMVECRGENICILPQVLDVNGEKFKLVVEYGFDDLSEKKWMITDNKVLYTKVYTIGLGEDVKVWIDNIHTDVRIVSTKDNLDGILQDSIDDRVHNDLMYGFPISNEVSFYGIYTIDGQNAAFVKDCYYGFNGSSVGSVEEKRYTEKRYLENGVYANKFSSNYGLLIQVGDNEPYCVDVLSDFVVCAYNKIVTEYTSGRVEIKTYRKDGSYEYEVIENEIETTNNSDVEKETEKVKKIN